MSEPENLPPGFAPRITPSSDSEWLVYYKRANQRLTHEVGELKDCLNLIADELGLPHGVTRQKSIGSMIINRIAELSKPNVHGDRGEEGNE